ncbi:MAG: hypothetical protein NTV46_22185, partial [Verrucomicrobia bacterium]|nr:hypothetical protein [Verrucomicrobiota bacterium]
QGKSGAMNATKGALTFGCASNESGGVEGAPNNFSSIQLDEVYIFNRALTAAEVVTLYGASIWDGGTGNWADSKWSGGQAPVTGRNMMISAASADSNVTLDADFSAQSLILGSTAASALTINSTKTLTLAEATVGASGTLQVDGTLTANSFDNRGSSTFSAGSALTFSGSASLLSLTGGTLTYDSTTPATPAMMRFYGGGLAGSGAVNATTKYEVWANTTVNLNLGGATTALDVIADFTATLNGTNTYGGQTYVRGGATLRAVDGVGLPSLSNLKIEDNSTIAFSGDLIRPSGTGPGQMQVSARHAHSAYGGPARLGFGTKVGEVITLENLVWNDGFFQHSEGWYIQRSNATDPIEIMNPIQLSTVATGYGSSSIFIQSGTQPVTFSGVLSGEGGALRLSSDWGTSPTATMILTAKNTYTGNTEIKTGKLILTAGAQLTFVTGATTGVNNTLTGPGYATLDGDFHIDTTLTDATTLTAGEWQLESVPSLGGAYGTTFRVVDSAGDPWTDAGSDTWTKTVGAKFYTFDETTGKLTLSVASGGSYASWAGTGDNAFDDDANNDGVDNGMAWVLGATDKDANAYSPTSLLPTLDTTDPNYFIFTYNRKDDANTDTKTTIKAEYCSDLATWTEAVHDGSNIIITPNDEGGGTGIDLVQVKIKRTLAVGGKLFVRLNVTQNLGGVLTYSISGKVTLNGVGLAGVTVSDGTRSAVTAAAGTYTITGVPDAATYTVTPSLSGYSFTPASASVPVMGVNVTGKDFTAAVAVGYASWAATNAGSQPADQDFNNDGVANGVAYFMNATGLATNPGINGTTKKVTWPNGGNIANSEYGADKQFVVQTSTDLLTWTNVAAGAVDLTNPNAVSYTLTGASPQFARLKVTPN